MSLQSNTLPKVCPQCGASFRKNQKYCSLTCSNSARTTRIERTCVGCGGKFTVTPFEIQSRLSVYCSRECADTYRKRGQTLTCLTCGTTFYAYPSQVRGGRAYCSIACRGPRLSEANRGKTRSAEQRARHSATMRGRPSPKKLPDYILDCKQCGRLFTIPGGDRQRASVARFCGTACWYTYIRENPKEHPAWRGGSFPFYGPDWLEQARRARLRDKYTCQDCGMKQHRRALDVHHIRSRREFAGDWKTANVLSNLVSLCKSCHRKRENAEGSP